jgi:hypothetical protein
VNERKPEKRGKERQVEVSNKEKKCKKEEVNKTDKRNKEECKK